MSSYGELIQALGALKNVKEKRHGIKTLASLCANRAFQVRIVQAGGWNKAILPLIISLDEDCRKYASLAVANLSTSTAAHPILLAEEVLRHVVPILHSEEVQEVVIYVLNALGNFACSNIMWQQLQIMNTIDAVMTTLTHATREEVKLNALFCIANLSSDPVQRTWMMENKTYEIVWQELQSSNYMIMQYSLAILRGLCVEAEAQELFPRMGLVPILIGIYQSQSLQLLRTLTLDIFLHLSFQHSNVHMLMEKSALACIESAARGINNIEYIPVGVAIIANLCENIDLHDQIIESAFFEVLSEHTQNENATIQMHVIRAFMQLSLSPKYHHVILATGILANICPIILNERLSVEMRVNALQMMGAVCATHPSTPTENDIMDLLYLICNATENINIRRSSMMVIANASADASNVNNLLRKPYLEALLLTLSKATDTILIDYMCQFFHNLSKMDKKAGSMMIQSGYERQMFTYEKLEGLSKTAAIYLCDTCRELAADTVVRGHLMEEKIFTTMIDAWVSYVQDEEIAPHLALMCSAFAYHGDMHQEFVLQGGVRLVLDLYNTSKVEHVRLCCLLSLLYLAETKYSQRSIEQERGMQTLLMACENETHIDLITNALKSLIPFAASDDYRPQLGMDGGIDTFSSFLFSNQLSLQQLGVFLLQNMLELKANRRIFLGLTEERKCEEDYLDALVRFLPKVNTGAPKRVKGLKKDDKGHAEESNLTPHDPFVVRSCIHSLALLSLEHSEEANAKFVDLQIHHLLYNLFHSEQIDRSTGEAVLLFFANMLHSHRSIQVQVMKGVDLIPMLLSCKEMDFDTHTNTRCLSALLSLSRTPAFRSRLLSHLDLIMGNVNANLSGNTRDETFYSTTAIHCALLCELARASYDYHEKMANVGVMEAFLVFITVAGSGLNGEICVELLMGAVYGISALVSSPRTGEHCMTNLLFPATRVQLLMTLLRLPQDDINNSFHMGTVGVRTLQRCCDPCILADELHVGSFDLETFLGHCGVRPADFLYRNVIRTLCLLLAHPMMGRRLLEAMSHKSIVPTCLLALRDSKDIFARVFGYLLVANFSADPNLQHSFVSDASILNELFNCVRRYSDSDADPAQDSIVAQLASQGTGPWTPKSVAHKMFVLAMVAMTNFAERAKEMYKAENVSQSGGPEEKGKLSFTNFAYMSRLTAMCLYGLDCDALLTAQRFEKAQEFTALLRIIVVHNSFVQRIELENVRKGGEVAVEPIGNRAPSTKPTGDDLVLPELRLQFKSLASVERKCQRLLEVVERCLETNAARPLVLAIVECLCGLTFLSPMSIENPHTAYRIIKSSPEWLHPSLTCLIVNTMADSDRLNPPPEPEYEGDEEPTLESEGSDYLFPLLATSTLEIRKHTLGFLANLGTNRKLFDFVIGSGVFRIFKALPSRAYFVEHFALMIECARLLTNVTCFPDTHDAVSNSDLMAFLRDILHNCFSLLEGGTGTKAASTDEPLYEYATADFTEDDVPPLGLRIRWEHPPYISEVQKNTPASRLGEPILEGDELIEVNGVDVQEMDAREIAPMFEDRPLRLLLRRKDDRTLKPGAPGGIGGSGLQVDEVQKVDAYGDRPQYLECFHLALITVHNLATVPANHDHLLAEPKILNLMLDIVCSEIISPTLRRLLFSALTCFAQQGDMSGRIFQRMSEYYGSCEKVDTSLNKYIMVCSNLFYTSMKAEEVTPDKSMLKFVTKLSEMSNMEQSNMALVEILHGMSRAPIESRTSFVSRDTLVVTLDFIELQDQWGVQVRAFECAYFLTLGACDPTIWTSLGLVPRMAQAANALWQLLATRDAKLQCRTDAAWEITIRTLDICRTVDSDTLLSQLSLPELDRYLMDLLINPSRPSQLVQCAAHLMGGLLSSKIREVCWNRWKSMGVTEKLVVWFKNQRAALTKDRRLKTEEDDDEAVLGESIDLMIHMSLFAVEIESALVCTLAAEDILFCIAQRILACASFYRQSQTAAPGNPADLAALKKTNAAFRWVAQLLPAMTTTEAGLGAMSGLNLEPALLSLLELRSDDFRVPALIMLCVLCGHKQTCTALIASDAFARLMRQLEAQLAAPAPQVPREELEYFVCILDRSCCHSDLADRVQERLFHLLCLLPVRAETVNARLLALRALTRCATVHPPRMGDLPIDGPACLRHVMALNACLRGDDDGRGRDDSMEMFSRRGLIAGIEELAKTHPQVARLSSHYARITLCESVSVSPQVCQFVFADIDFLALLSNMSAAFEAAHARVADDSTQKNLAAGELLNILVSTLHIFLCVVFRQGMPGVREETPHYVVDALLQLLEAVNGYLHFGAGDGTARRDGAPAKLAEALAEDIRVIFYITALLREICAKPLHSAYINVVRSRRFCVTLEACITLAKKRHRREVDGHSHKDIYRNKPTSGVTTSPLLPHMDDFELAFVFEHIVVCLRHLLVQSVYVGPAAQDGPEEPWRWAAQETMPLHQDAINWIPDVLKRHGSTAPAIGVEVVRYFCAVSVFYESPYASPQAPPGEAPAEGAAAAPALPAPGVRMLARTFSILEPRVLGIVTGVLESSEDPCTLNLACFAAANLSGHETPRVAEARSLGDGAQVQDLLPLVRGLVRVLRALPTFPHELKTTFIVNAFRVLDNLLSFGITNLTCEIMDCEVLDAVQGVFDQFFKDLYRLDDIGCFTVVLRRMILLLRNCVCAGCLAEAEHEQGKDAAKTPKDKKIYQRMEEIYARNLDVSTMLNVFIKVVLTLVNTERSVEIQDLDVMSDEAFEDALTTIQTLLRRSDVHNSANWKKLHRSDYELLLERIKDHRYKRSQEFEDDEIMNILYLMTKQGFPYSKMVFPDYLMEVAYGERTEHTVNQDVASVCCAIISTQGSQGRGASVNVSNVVKDHAQFVNNLAKVPDPKLQLWHYRLLMQWSGRPRVLEDISTDPAAIRFVAQKLLDPTLWRYSVVILHNVSVLQAEPLLRAGEHLATVCEAFRALKTDSMPDVDDAMQPVFLRLLLATARNCILGVEDLETKLSTTDLTAIVGLADAVAGVDIPMYLAILLHVCQRCSPARVAGMLPKDLALMELLMRYMTQHASACQPSATGGREYDSDVYGFLPREKMAAEMVEEEEEGEGEDGADVTAQLSPTRRAQAVQSPVRGLGKKMSLYQKSRQTRARAEAPVAPKADAGAKRKPAAGAEVGSAGPEFVYFAVAEILTSTTFLEGGGRPDDAVQDAVDAVFSKHPVASWLKALKEQVDLHEKRRVVLSDLFVQVTAKFLWHCWSNPTLRPHIDIPSNLEILAGLAPFFLDWPSRDVQNLVSEVALYAGLHRFPVVCEYLTEHHTAYPELTCAVLAHALVDDNASITSKQAIQYIAVFCELLRNRCISPSALKRVVVGFETALLTDHPRGLGPALLQYEHALLGGILDQLNTYKEYGFVRQGIVVVLAFTVGAHYKPLPQLDQFVLGILDMVPALLETEFVVLFPVLYCLAMRGGKRVQAPILSRQLHSRVARLFEKDIDIIEEPYRRGGSKQRLSSKKPDEPAEARKPGPHLSARERVQWHLAFFTGLARNQVAHGAPGGAGIRGSVGAPGEQLQDMHFETFVCVELLPALIRILKLHPTTYDAISTCYLMSAVATSPCIPPHMPDIFRLAGRAFPMLFEDPQGGGRPLSSGGMDDTLTASWRHLGLLPAEQMELSMRRSFVHLLANAGYLPEQNAALFANASVFSFLTRLERSYELFADPSAPLHTTLYCLAHLCTRADDHKMLLDFHILEVLETIHEYLVPLDAAEAAAECCDLRILWIHSVVSLTSISGAKLLSSRVFVGLLLTALQYAEDVLFESLSPDKRARGARGLALGLGCHQALGACIVPLSSKLGFDDLRQPYTRYLLCLINSASLTNIRISACDSLVEVLVKGYKPEIPGGVLLSSTCAESFKRAIVGPIEELAAAVSRVMIAFAQKSGHAVHVHLLGSLEAVVAMLGNPTSGTLRIVALARLFVALAKERKLEVLDKLITIKDVTAFLGLARSKHGERREIVQEWLEGYGSSLYEIDEVIEVFQINTIRGLFHMCARCTLEVSEAQDLRRRMFKTIHRHMGIWRASLHGAKEFLSEDLMGAMLPMCELQPDLVAGVVALFHSFMSHNEHALVERIWSGGHFGWLCKRMTHKSRAQLSQVQLSGVTSSAPSVGKGWERHLDLAVTQGMALRLINHLYDLHPQELPTKAVKSDCVVKNFRDYVTYYCHFAWPLRESKEVEEATDTTVVLAMQTVARIARDLNESMQQKLIQQGLLGFCFTVLLPSPPDQQAMRAAIGAEGGGGDHDEGADVSDIQALPDARMIAGSIVARLSALRETYHFVAERRYANFPVAMLSQLHHWRAAIFDQQGSVSSLVTVGLLERVATLYMALLSVLHVGWCLDHLGLQHMGVFGDYFLEIWSRHSNDVLRHHAMRFFTNLCQVHILYVSIMSEESKAQQVMDAIHRTFGKWDIRELRYIMRLIVASLAHALGIPTLPEHINQIVARNLQKSGCEKFLDTVQKSGILRSNYAAGKHLLVPRFLKQVLGWCEYPGDNYGRAWSLWLVLTMIAHEVKATDADANKPTPTAPASQPEGVLVFPEEVNEEHLLRRAKFLAEQQAAMKQAPGQGGPGATSLRRGEMQPPPKCHTGWLRKEPAFVAILARMACHSLKLPWRDANHLGCVGMASCVVELPLFLNGCVETADGQRIVSYLAKPDKTLNFSALLLITIVSSFQLPLKAQNVAQEFLARFHSLQQVVIEGLCQSGKGPYDLVAEWLHRPSAGLPCEGDFRCLIAFMMGQCLCPPLAAAPSLDIGAPAAAPGRVLEVLATGRAQPPQVAECDPPPAVLLDVLAREALQEDLRLRQAQADGKGPLFSTILCHLLYSLAVMVPLHPKAAAHSSAVRGAAFSQLMKVQNIVSHSIQPRALFDPADGKRDKLFLYIRATTCVRAALQCIMGSWFAADFGANFVISEEGGRDFMQYCTKHINQAYNNKTALTRVIGSPWERVMLSQGPTSTIADLLLVVCSSDKNLVEVSNLGGDQALHNLSRYGEVAQIRQQATMLLTKLAVMTQAPGAR